MTMPVRLDFNTVQYLLLKEFVSPARSLTGPSLLGARVPGLESPLYLSTISL